MPTRYNSKSKEAFHVPGLPSGYDDTAPAPHDLAIPPCGIEDVDVALFKLFDKEVPFQVGGGDVPMSKCPVLFAAGEKWAMLKRGRALRDRNNSLILPLITIMRTTFQQVAADDIVGRGINQQTGEIIIQRRLDASDRAYQGLINRALIKHQGGLAVSPAQADPGQLSTIRPNGDLADDPTIQEGGLLMSDRRNNFYETLVVPAPQFYTAVYEVTFWAQYTQHMNQLTEQLVSSFLPQGNAWQLNTPKGYWFIATVDGNVYAAESNFDDMSQEERLIKMKFTVKVPAYVLASGVPGAPVPIRRYVSAPQVTFGIDEQPFEPDTIADPFLGADDPTLPLTNVGSKRRDQRRVGATRLYPNPDVVPPDDPARKAIPRGQPLARYKRITAVDQNGKTVTRYARVASQNTASGETVFAPGTDLGGLTIIVVDDS